MLDLLRESKKNLQKTRNTKGRFSIQTKSGTTMRRWWNTRVKRKKGMTMTDSKKNLKGTGKNNN